MASFLDLINDADSFPLDHHDRQEYYRLQVVGVPGVIGYVHPPVLAALRGLPNWEADDEMHTITLFGGADVEERSIIVEQTLQTMRGSGSFEELKRWRQEQFAVYGPGKEVLFNVERCAAPLFGVVSYGVHALAYVPPQPGEPLRIWISCRATTKATYAGMLDSSAAGGIESGVTPLETLLRECEEEASLDRDFVRGNVRAAGVVTNFLRRSSGAGGDDKLLQPECHYVFDLPLPPDVKCKKNDGEVAEFYLWTVGRIQQALANREFKPNSALVMIDFLIRHGFLTEENERDYIEIVSRIHRRFEFPMR